jgi:hypothetical protein
MCDIDARTQVYLDQLVAGLNGRGLQVVAKLPELIVRNPAVSGDGPEGRAMSPGLGQKVLIRNEEGRGLTWCWVWPSLRSAERGVPTPPPEIEPMCPAEQIERAADLITNVVCLRDPELVGGGEDA